ncbi:hypothetical protein AV929_16180 [Haloarcula sp. K1]|nr:hypothetical protein AV929_16180 [Haloarcula sp. K1]
MPPLPPTEGWEIGPNPAVPSPEQVYEILIYFFNAYLISVTSFLAYSIIVLVILYRLRGPTSYGTQSKRKRLHRSSTALLVASAIFPILYAAMWIAKGTTSAGPDLPAGGVFGTPLEERIIGPNPSSRGLDQFLGILIDLFQAYFLSWTTLGVVALLSLVVIYYTTKWPTEIIADVQSRYIRRVGIAVGVVTVFLPLLYTVVWVATDTQKTPEALPADGVFGTSFEERLIGPEAAQGIDGLVSGLGMLFQTYQVSISFILISAMTFLSVSYLLIHWPFRYDIGNKQEHLYRAALGLGGSITIVPILHAISWLATGLSNPEGSLTRVAPPVQLPTGQLFSGARYHPVIEELAASKDPVETVLLNFLSFQTTSYLMLGIFVIALGAVMMLLFARSSWFPSIGGHEYLSAGSIILLVVFLMPALVTASAWLTTGTADAGDTLSENLAGRPFHEQDDFSACTTEDWEAKSGTAIPVDSSAGQGCELEIHGTISKQFDLTGTEHEEGFVEVKTDDEMTVRIYDGDELVAEKDIISNRRFEISVTNATTVEIKGKNSKLDSVTAGLQPVPDPYLVVELMTEDDEFILRNGVDADVRIYNIGETETVDTFNLTVASEGTLYGGDERTPSDKLLIEQLDGGQWREYPITKFTSFRENRVVGDVNLIAATNLDEQEMLQRGPGWDNYDNKTITITYADLRSDLSEGRTVYENTTSFDARIYNNGTAFSEASPAELVITDENGNKVHRETITLAELDPEEDSVTEITNTYRAPGTYTATLDVEDDLFPEGNIDQTEFQIIHGDVRAEVSETESTSRVGTNTNFTVDIWNAGNNKSEATTADVEVVGPSGDVVKSWNVDVENLSVGQSTAREFTVVTEKTGTYHVNVDAHYPEFSAGTTDSATVAGIGPDLRTDVTGNTIKKGEQADITTEIRNKGTDYAEPTTAQVNLTNPDGTLIEQAEIEVPGLSPGESYSTNPVSSTLNEPGTYQVSMDADAELATTGTKDTDEFNVVYQNLGVEVSASNVSHSDDNQMSIDVTNHGTGLSEPTSVNVDIVDPAGKIVTERTLDVGRLQADQSTIRRFEVNHDRAGVHRAEASLDGQTYHTNYHITWSNLQGTINASETTVDGFETKLNATIGNVGPGRSGVTYATVTVYDSDNRRVDRKQIDVDELASGETDSNPVSVKFPEVGTYTAKIELHDNEFPDGNVDYSEEIVTAVPDHRTGIHVSNISNGETAYVNTTVVNAGEVLSDETTATVTLKTDNGEVLETTQYPVGRLQPSDKQTNTPLARVLDEPGRYIAEVKVDDSRVPRGNVSKTAFYVRGGDLRANITARDIGEGQNVDISTQVANYGGAVSENTTATVTIENDAGRVINRTTVDVRSLQPGEDQTNLFSNVTLESPGRYVAKIDVNAKDDTTGSVARNGFQTEYVNLKGFVSSSDVTTTNKTTINVTIANDGTAGSDPVDTTVEVVDDSGMVVQEWNISTDSIRGGRDTRRHLEFTTSEAGSYTVTVDVEDQGRPSGTTDSDEFSIRWPDLAVDVTPSASVVESNETTVDVNITNNGPGSSQETTTRVYLYDNFGNILSQQTISLPEVASGATYETTVSIHFTRPGVHSVGARVDDSKFPDGNYAETDDITVSHGNLHGSVSFRNDSTPVESETAVTVSVQNVGNDKAEATTATVALMNPNEEVVETHEVDIRALNAGSNTDKRVKMTPPDDGKYTVQLNVRDEEFPVGAGDTDTIQVLSSDLRADITVEDVELNHRTDVNVTVTNAGDLQSNQTTAEVRMYNQDGDRVTHKTLEIDSLAPGESTTVSYSQLIDERCWKTEMSCAPGVTVGTGTYTAEVNVQTVYAPEGSVDTVSFKVE